MKHDLMQHSRFWPMLATLLGIDIVLGFAYAALPISFDLGRDSLAALQLVALAGTMIYTLARVSRDF